MFKALRNAMENKIKGKAEGMRNAHLAKALIFAAPFLINTIILVMVFGPIIMFLAGITYFLEIKTHADTNQSLYTAVEEITGSSEVNGMVKIVKDGNSYYYKFADGIIDKLEENLKKSSTRYVELGLKNSSLLQIFMEAQLTTQLPDLNGTKVASINTTVDSVVDEGGSIDVDGQLVVAIMAGHNKTETGASYNELREEEMTVKVAKYVEDILASDTKANKIKVVQVGSTVDNLYVLDAGRLKKAISANANMLISIHFNASETHNLNGVSICYNKAGTAQYTENGTQQSIATEDSSQDSRKLGNILKSNVATSMGLTVTNDYAKPLFTIGGQKEGFPSVIIEGGYIDGNNDYGKFSSQKDEILRKYAQGIVNGIYEYLGM